MRSGINYRETAAQIRNELLARIAPSARGLTETVATGLGANNVSFAHEKASDIICTARGMNRIFRQARTVIDVGGQSTRAIRIDPEGRITNFTISEKCAAGSGRFVEVIANVLRIDLKEFGPLSLVSQNPITFSTACAVFGESEAITRVAEAIPKEDIAAGVNKALASKIFSLVRKVKLEEPCAICGAGVHNMGLIKVVEKELNCQLLIPPQPQIVAALGAAMIASNRGKI